MPRAYTERGPKRILNARMQAVAVTRYAGSTAFGDRRLQFRKNESERKVEPARTGFAHNPHPTI